MNRPIPIFLLLTLLAPAASADVPHLISYQGRIQSDAGVPLDTTVDLEFRIYADSLAPAEMWSEFQKDVVITDGLFEVTLGSATPLTPGIFTGARRWLSMAVGGGSWSSPRTPFVSTAYAYRAISADTADYARGVAGVGWSDDGTVVRLQNATDSVAVGSLDPEYPLDVRSPGVAIYGRTTGGLGTAGVYGRAETTGFGIMGTSTSGRGVYGASTSGFGGYFVGPTTYVSGNLGLGTETPTHKLTVNGSIALQSAGDTKFHIGYYNGGLNISETSIADYRLNIEVGGNVGIGTGSPAAKLHVNGNTRIDGELTAGTFYSSNITDAPGIASAAAGGTYVSIPVGWKVLLRREITVPAEGYILALGTVQAYMEHGITGNTTVTTGISADSTTVSEDYVYRLWLNHALPDGTYHFPVPCRRLFHVASAGTYTYYLLASRAADNSASAYTQSLDLIFIRTVYASKEGALAENLFPDGISGELTSSDFPQNRQEIPDPSRVSSSDLADKVSSLESELAYLRQRLQALEENR